MIEINEFATNLERNEHGIWFAATRSEIAYPENGNAWCLQVEENSFWFRHRRNCILEAVRLYPPNGAFFDVGGGNGFVSLAIREMGIDTVLVEPGIEGAANAHNRGLECVICSTLEDAGFKPDSIPAIGLFDLLEHIEDDVAFLRTANRLLSPNGKVYITVPAYNFLASFEDKRSRHYRRYTTTELAKKLESAGFEINLKTYIFSMLPVPIFLVRTIPSMLRLRRKSELGRIQREHAQPAKWLGRLLNVVLDKELRTLRNKRTIPFGGSCLVVATAKK